MDAKHVSERDEQRCDHELHATPPGGRAQGVNGSSGSPTEPGKRLDERSLQKGEESVEAIRHD